MPRNDPTDTGGLFIGRRPGTAPLRYRGAPAQAGGVRRRTDSALAGAILAIETLLLATLWAPQPAGWLWIGAQIFHDTGSVSFGILVAFLGMLLTILLTIRLTMSLDHTWKLVRRASGHEQHKGALERIFVSSMVLAATAFFVWFLAIHGPRLAPLTPGPGL